MSCEASGLGRLKERIWKLGKKRIGLKRERSRKLLKSGKFLKKSTSFICQKKTLLPLSLPLKAFFKTYMRTEQSSSKPKQNASTPQFSQLLLPGELRLRWMLYDEIRMARAHPPRAKLHCKRFWISRGKESERVQSIHEKLQKDFSEVESLAKARP